MVVNAQSEMVEERDGEPVIFSFIQNYISVFFFFFTRTLGTASPLPCFRKKNPHICIILCSPSSKFPLPTICGCAALPWEHAVSSEFLCLRYHSAFALQSHEWGHYKGLLDD